MKYSVCWNYVYNSTLQDVASVDDLDVATTETAPLFMYLEFGFLLDYDLFATSSRQQGRNPYEEFKRVSRNSDMISRVQAIPTVASRGKHEPSSFVAIVRMHIG